MLITQAKASHCQSLAKLLFSSGPDNLISLLTGHQSPLTLPQKQKICIEFLETALQLAEGQFGYLNQQVAIKNGAVCGCVSYWQAPISDLFKQQTLASLVTHFGITETAAILNNSEALSTLVRAPSANELSIGHLAVEPINRRQGVATCLLDYCSEAAIKLGKSTLVLDVMEDNQSAIQTYLNFGFVQKSKSQPSEKGKKIGFLPHIHMQKSLV
ncbi:MAG: GNAT family N-acetyltransferase [Aliiglaciecola sp.]|uniref:GNAT family N-acetyltransferase n=1 Tax=Aliiglaciecola sp. TaxID=1872441 RepID=UPI003299A775